MHGSYVYFDKEEQILYVHIVYMYVTLCRLAVISGCESENKNLSSSTPEYFIYFFQFNLLIYFI